MNTPGLELKINAATSGELSSLVISLAQQFGVKLSNTEAQTIVEAEVETVKDEVKKPVAKKETKKKEEVVAEVVEEVVAESAAVYTKQDIADACQKVSTAKNLDAAKAILAKFNARRISDVAESDYAAFVAECEKAVK